MPPARIGGPLPRTSRRSTPPHRGSSVGSLRRVLRVSREAIKTGGPPAGKPLRPAWVGSAYWVGEPVPRSLAASGRPAASWRSGADGRPRTVRGRRSMIPSEMSSVCARAQVAVLAQRLEHAAGDGADADLDRLPIRSPLGYQPGVACSRTRRECRPVPPRRAFDGPARPSPARRRPPARRAALAVPPLARGSITSAPGSMWSSTALGEAGGSG